MPEESILRKGVHIPMNLSKYSLCRDRLYWGTEGLLLLKNACHLFTPPPLFKALKSPFLKFEAYIKDDRPGQWIISSPKRGDNEYNEIESPKSLTNIAVLLWLSLFCVLYSLPVTQRPFSESKRERGGAWGGGVWRVMIRCMENYVERCIFVKVIVAISNKVEKKLKGPKYEIFVAEFFNTTKACMVRWLGNWEIKLIF